MINSINEENKNKTKYISLKTEPNSSSQKKVHYFSDNINNKKNTNNKFKFGDTFNLKTNDKLINTGNNIFYLKSQPPFYSRRYNKKNHVIKLKNNMLLNSRIPGCSPYDPYLIKVCKKAIINVKKQLPNYKDVIKKINSEFGIEEDNDYRRVKNNKLVKTFNTFSEFKTGYSKRNDNLFEKNNINSITKVLPEIDNKQK